MPATSIKKNGSAWEPKFIISLDKKKCIACGRCYKGCPSGVMQLQSEEDDEENEIMFMEMINDGECIGCKSCAMVCPKACFVHAG
jgi:Nif-specific ferredoxin III